MDNRKITMDNLEYYNSKLQEKFRDIYRRLNDLETEIIHINEAIGRIDSAEVDISEFKIIMGDD